MIPFGPAWAQRGKQAFNEMDSSFFLFLLLLYWSCWFMCFQSTHRKRLTHILYQGFPRFDQLKFKTLRPLKWKLRPISHALCSHKTNQKMTNKFIKNTFIIKYHSELFYSYKVIMCIACNKKNSPVYTWKETLIHLTYEQLFFVVVVVGTYDTFMSC